MGDEMQLTNNAQSESIALGEQLYQADLHFTKITEYGFNLTDFLSGTAVPPAAGARVDVAFAGTLSGSRINGRMSGVDYLHIRGDGQTRMHIHAEITTEDNEKIAFFGDGVIAPDQATGLLVFRERVTFTTACPVHSWISSITGWGQGTVDPAKGQINVTLFSI
jgi:Protein of unknown function (DUF3237)